MGINVNIKYAGWDSGYDACKLITDLMQRNNKDPLIFPSLAKERTSSIINEKDLGMGQEISKERMLVEVQDKDDKFYDYMIGDYVVTQLETGGTNYEVDKYQSPEELAKLLAGLSVLHSNATKITIDTLVTGLPIQHCKTHKEKMKERFTGRFAARINNQKGEKVTVIYEIKNVIVIPQAAGALMYYLTLTEDSDVLNDIIGLIDVGGRTTDGLAYNKGEIIKGSPFSSNIGMSDVFRTVSTEINIDENQIREAVIRDQDSITYKQEEVGIKGLVEDNCEKVANDIAKITRSEWRDFIDLVNKILIVGGAGEKIEAYLSPAYGKIKVEVIPSSQSANVLGYLLRGQSIYEKKVAEQKAATNR